MFEKKIRLAANAISAGPSTIGIIHALYALTFAVARGCCLKASTLLGRGFKLLPRDMANANAHMCDRYSCLFSVILEILTENSKLAESR